MIVSPSLRGSPIFGGTCAGPRQERRSVERGGGRGRREVESGRACTRKGGEARRVWGGRGRDGGGFEVEGWRAGARGGMGIALRPLSRRPASETSQW